MTTFVYDQVHRQYKTVRGTTTTIDTYDAVADIATERISSTETFTYDADNEETRASFSSTNWITFTWDKDGNKIAYQTSLGDTGTWSYDYENRLISLSGGCSYTYAPTGERVTDSCASAPTMRYDDGTSNLVADYSTSNARQDRYVHADAVDSPVEMVAGSTYYGYETDALGSVNRLTDINGNSPETYAYDPWGATTPSGGVHNPFQFTGRTLDTSGLYDYRARSYDPTANGGHRFMSSDPIGVDSYAYVGDAPANFVDPSGMDPIPVSAPSSSCSLGQLLNGDCPSESGTSGTGGGTSGTYRSAYCDSWAVRAGICIPDNNAPDATLPSPPTKGNCANWGAVAAGAGLIVIGAAVAIMAVAVAGPEILLEPHIAIFILGLVVSGGLAIGVGLNQPCS